MRALGSAFGGLGAVLGAGVFAGIAPAAAVSGRWLPLGVAVAALLACCAAGSGQPRSARVPVPAADLLAGVFAAAAVAGTCGLYLTPQRPLVGAVSLLVVVAAVRYLLPALPAVVERIAVGAVLVVLVVFVVSCFALGAPGNPPVPAGLAGADSAGGGVAAGAVLVIAFGGLPARGRFVMIGLLTVLLGAVAVAALYQLGGGRLAISPVPLRDALAAAAGSPIDGLLTFGVALGCALVLYHLLPGVRDGLLGSVVPAHRLLPAAVVVLAGGLLVALLSPVQVLLGCAAAVLLSWLGGHLGVLSSSARPRWRLAVAAAGLLGAAAALVALAVLDAAVVIWVTLSTVLLALFAAVAARR